MHCSKCGTQNIDSADFCIKCGNNLISVAKPVEYKGITGKLCKMGVPGFRSRKTWKMALATFVYFSLFSAIIIGFSEQPHQQLKPVQTYPQTHTTPLEKPTAELAVSGFYMRQIMSGVYNQYSNINKSLIEYRVVNNGDKAVKLSFMAEIQDYTSQSTDIITVQSNKKERFPALSLLRTVHATFTAYGSSIR